MRLFIVVFFFQAEDGIRDWSVTGVQTCALPILLHHLQRSGEGCERQCDRAALRLRSRHSRRQRSRWAQSEVDDSLGIRGRSEERRVGKECRSRGSPYHEKKKAIATKAVI